jgi:hypothetical protein
VFGTQCLPAMCLRVRAAGLCTGKVERNRGWRALPHCKVIERGTAGVPPSLPCVDARGTAVMPWVSLAKCRPTCAGACKLS